MSDKMSLQMEGALVTAEVDLDAIAKNVACLKSRTREGTRFMAVVKADGYGHGAVRVAQKALACGATMLGVARFHEAVELRMAGIQAPILVFGWVDPALAERAAKLDLTLSVYNFDMAQALSDSVCQVNQSLTIHIKIDTGMGRVGIQAHEPEERQAAIRHIQQIKSLPNLAAEGIYTHFASADSPEAAYTREQIKRFDVLLSDLQTSGIKFELRHAANSAGIIDYPEAHYDMVRAGISLYGLYPSNEVEPSRIELFPAMTLKSIVSAVREVPKGFKVSYGMTYETDAPTRLASVPIGYADGFSRRFSSNGAMLVKGKRAPIVGRVCMDQTLINVGAIEGVKAGDPVVLFGRQNGSKLHAEELARSIGTINYEIVSALTARVRRIYSDTDSASGSG